MAKLFVSEFKSLARGRGADGAAIPVEPALANQALTIGAEVKSSAFNADTRYVELAAEAACFVKFGSNPTAVTASDMFLAAGARVVRAVVPGQKVSVII